MEDKKGEVQCVVVEPTGEIRMTKINVAHWRVRVAALCLCGQDRLSKDTPCTMVSGGMEINGGYYEIFCLHHQTNLCREKNPYAYQFLQGALHSGIGPILLVKARKNLEWIDCTDKDVESVQCFVKQVVPHIRIQ